MQTMFMPFAEARIGTKFDGSHRGLPSAGQQRCYPCSAVMLLQQLCRGRIISNNVE